MVNVLVSVSGIA